MKKVAQILGLGVLLLVVSTGQLAAQKCKFDYEKKDQITGEQTKGNTFSIKMWWKLGFNKAGDKYFLGMVAVINGNVRDIISPENTIIFKLANGEIITLYANDNHLPTAQATQYGVQTTYNAKYNISKEDLEKLAASPLVYIRMGIGETRRYESEFKTKEGTDFQNKARCILQ